MKQKIWVLLCMLMAALALPSLALADDVSAGDTGSWHVTYTSAGNLEDDYSSSEYAAQVKKLQPGDTITFEVNLSHENENPGEWYLSSQVIRTLEESSQGLAAGGAYGYYLAYSGPEGEKVLFDSASLGGDNAAGGLDSATSALKEYVYLDRLSHGQKAKVTLKVSLDGETEGDAYFDTLAQVKMGFAVTPTTSTSVEEMQTVTRESSIDGRRTMVKTGDEVRLFPFYVLMVVSGLLLLALAVQSLRMRAQEGKENAR